MSIELRIDTSDMQRLGAQLGAAGRVVGLAQSRAINRVAGKAQTRLRKGITSIVRLKAGYVRERMKLKRATVQNPTAVIESRERATRLARFGASQITARAASSKPRQGKKGRRLAPRKLKGDVLRGIRPGRKAAGVSVHVLVAGARKRMEKAFLIPLRAGNVAGGNAMGVFTREGPGRRNIRHRYSMSVAAWARAVAEADDYVSEIQSELDDAFIRQLRHELDRAFS